MQPALGVSEEQLIVWNIWAKNNIKYRNLYLSQIRCASYDSLVEIVDF